MREKLISVLLIVGILLAGVLAGLNWTAEAANESTPWPGEVRLWNGDTGITQTTRYRGIDMIGAEQRYLFFDSGIPSTTGTVTITVKSMWQGVEFASTTTSASADLSTAATGAITIASGHPYYPAVLVGAEISAGTFTPTIAVVGQ